MQYSAPTGSWRLCPPAGRARPQHVTVERLREIKASQVWWAEKLGTGWHGLRGEPDAFLSRSVIVHKLAVAFALVVVGFGWLGSRGRQVLSRLREAHAAELYR